MKKSSFLAQVIIVSTIILLITTVTGEAASWYTKTPMPTARAMTGSAVYNSRIYVMGGERYAGDAITTNEVYDPATDSWTDASELPNPRRWPYVEAVNDKIYVIGGACDPLGWIVEDSNYIYDPETDQWASGSPMPFKQGGAVSAVWNGKIYIFGGYTPEYNTHAALDFNQRYDPSTDSWLSSEWGQLAPLPTPRDGLRAAVVNDKIYVIGGCVIPGPNTRIRVGTNEMYDPTTDTWTTKAPMPTPRCCLSLAVLNNKIYAIGGNDENYKCVSTVEEYDPETDSWKTIENMPTARMCLSTEAVSGAIYAIGGQTDSGSVLSTNEAFQYTLLPLSVSISPLSASIPLGHSITFTSTISGGSAPYSYQWHLNGNPISGATSETWVFAPTASGIFYVFLQVTDSNGNITQSETARIVAESAPVGGYSIPIETLTTEKPLAHYLFLTAILTIAIATIKRKALRKHA